MPTTTQTGTPLRSTQVVVTARGGGNLGRGNGRGTVNTMLRTAITSIFLISRGTQAARGYLPANLPATWERDSRGYVRLVGGIPHAPDSPPATPTLPPTASRKCNNSSCPPF